MMISNINSMLPRNWVIQIFYDPTKETALDGIQYQAIQRLIYKGVVHLTSIPFIGAKKRDLMASTWLWDAMLADRVFFFGGSGVLCGNSPYSIESLNKFQFIADDDNLFSSRNRTLMLEALRDNKKKKARDDEIISTYISSNKERLGSPLVPTPLDRDMLANGPVSSRPLGVFGTLPALSTAQRTEWVEYCPEMKILFPSLIANPCFGSSPEPILCMQYLCQEGGLSNQCMDTSKSVEFIAETKKGRQTRLVLTLKPSTNQAGLNQTHPL